MAARRGQTDKNDTPTRASLAPRRGPMSEARRRKAQETFLAEYAACGNLTQAARAAAIHRATVYEWQEHDEAFGLRFKQAEAEACDVLRGEAFARAVTGWEEPVLSMGKLVYGEDGRPLTIRKKSDSVLLAMLKAHLPEYRDKQQVEHSGEQRIVVEFRRDWRGSGAVAEVIDGGGTIAAIEG